MSKPLEVTYDVAEVEGLTEANEILGSLRAKVGYNLPAWQKLHRASNYIQNRQKEVLASALADPEADT